MDLNRREALTALAAFASLAGPLAQAQQTHPDTSAQPGSPIPARTPNQTVPASQPLSQSRVFRFSQMPLSDHPNGGWSRAVLHGTLPTGEFVEVHESMLPPGQQPHLPHHHRNSEFILLREGTLEYLNEGSPEPVSPGDVIFTASDRTHGLRNPGTVPALYYVVSISHGQL